MAEMRDWETPSSGPCTAIRRQRKCARWRSAVACPQRRAWEESRQSTRGTEWWSALLKEHGFSLAESETSAELLGHPGAGTVLKAAYSFSASVSVGASCFMLVSASGDSC